MSLLFLVLPLSLALVAVAVVVFVWATRSGQFDDLETPARRVLFDDDDGRRPDSTLPRDRHPRS